MSTRQKETKPGAVGLDWKTSSDAVYMEGMRRLYFPRKLRCFNVCRKMLEISYQSVGASAIYFAVVCWAGSISVRDASRMNELIHKAGTIIGKNLEVFEPVRDRRSLDKLLSITNNPSHFLHATLQKQQSSFP